MPLLTPIRPGDRIGIVAPSGPFSAERYARGLEVLRTRGYQLREFLPPGPWRYLAATDEARTRAFEAAFSDPEVDAVVAVRGGYGAMRILPAIDWDAVVSSGKAFVGFSDATALHLAMLSRGGRAIHGPVLTQLGEQPPESVERLFSLLESGAPPAPIPGRQVVAGDATGPLVGGCLSLVSRLAGTPYLPSLDGAILLLEDVGEKPYRLDRMWTQLVLTGVLRGVAGIVLGDFTECINTSTGLSGALVLEELASTLGKPVLAGLPIGHGALNLAVPLGSPAAIRGGSLCFLEEKA